MTAPELPPAPAPLPEAPYVGVRPYERNERAIFTGRDRDAELLRNKVLSARLTILYGASGSGKTSVLRTLLIPRLEEEWGARVLYCDAWRDEDPVATLRTRLIGEAERLEIPDPEAGDPSLTDLIRLLQSVDGRTLILALDQFEELFTTRGAPLDSFSKELGGLVRASGVDVRIVLSLREEHLAALEPFRSEVLDLFHSTYRLVPLSASSTREAIEKPLGLFGASYEPGLVTEMEHELSQEQKAGVRLGAEQVEADLPRLQLVCDELWKEAKRRQVKVISQGLYRELGGRQGILESYLGKVMPHSWRGQRLTARLLQHLAPQDGHKVPYSADSLASLTGFPLERVSAELQRLTKARVLRSRQYGAGGVLYELWHDSFIRILAPWCDRILRRDRVWRWSWSAASALPLLVLAAALGGSCLGSQRELYENTTAVWGDPSRTIEGQFDHVAHYLLWARGKDPKNLERLRAELEPREDLLPSDYGVDNTGLLFVTLPEEEDWPLTLSYSEERELDPYRFTQAWQQFTRFIHESWGIPLPAKVKLAAKYAYPKELMTLTGPQTEPLPLKVPLNEQNALISERDLSEPGTRFLDRFKSEWDFVREAKHGGPFWIVPRWSLPAWKASGTQATDGSGVPAFLLLRELQRSPERLLTPDAVEALLGKAAESHPLTVAEARAVRGERLTQDLRELVRQGRSLNELPVLLDFLSDDPEGSPAEIGVAGGQLQGPHATRPSATDAPGGKPPKVHRAYEEVMPNLSVSGPAIRVYLGQRLEQAWVSEQGELIALQRVEAVRADMLRRFGVVIPGVSFRGAGWGWDVPQDSFQIVMLDELPADAVTVQVGKGDELERLEAALTWRVQGFRDYFVSAESVDSELRELKKANAGLHAWLVKNYSLTDLKRLLRAVITPSSEEIAELWQRLKMEGRREPVEVPPEETVRHPAWLLGSLLFWSELHEPYSVEALAEDLRKTQRARLTGAPGLGPQRAEVTKRVEVGIQALDEGRIPEAEAAFSQAIALDPRAAEASFLAHYAGRQQSQLVQEFAHFCEPFQPNRSPEARSVTVFRTPLTSLGDELALLEKRMDLRELLGAEGLTPSLDPATARRLRLCLLATLPKEQEKERLALARQLQEQHGPPEDWPADDAAWFGQELLKGFDPVSGDGSVMQAGMAYLESGFQRLEEAEAVALFPSIRELCKDPGPTLWCWSRLVPALAGAREEPVIVVSFAGALARRDVREDAERALALAARAKERLRTAALPVQERQRLLDWAELSRADALDSLARLGAGGDDAEEEAILLRLQGSRHLGTLPATSLADLMRRQNRLEEVVGILDEAMKKWPEDVVLHAERLAAMLLVGDEGGVSQVAAEAFQKARVWSWGRTREQQEELRFIAAIGLLITKGELWEQAASEFLKTHHPNVPYVAMLLYSRLPEASREVAWKALEDLWKKARPDTWQARLRQGDETAWSEMLIGYYLGKKDVSREQIFAELEDEESFARSARRNVPKSRLGMLCDAYFYDALLAESRGDMAARNASLEKAVGTHQTSYFEYAMAHFLLAQQSVGGSGR